MTEPDFTKHSSIQTNKIFTGKIKDEKFILRRVHKWTYNANRPTIYGKILKDNNNGGSIIKIKYRSRNAFIFFYFIGSIIIGYSVYQWYLDNHERIYLFVFFFIELIWLIFNSILGAILFYIEYKKTKQIFENYIKENSL
ncbi:MAG TPA: hypothetical protein P5514_04800 [Bacteroidales bacterium]|nr:hypothetical protein [Bacteroidales bacterium]HRX96240.1 hypothetical protein [Bacteroidales bacterium]